MNTQSGTVKSMKTNRELYRVVTGGYRRLKTETHLIRIRKYIVSIVMAWTTRGCVSQRHTYVR